MGKCKVTNSLLRQKDSLGATVSEWLMKTSEYDGRCIVCDCPLSVAKGHQSIEQHVNTAKHRNNYSTKLTPLQLHLAPQKVTFHDTIHARSSNAETLGSKLQLCNFAENSSRAELIWTMKTVVSNYSAASCDGIGDLFRSMFQGVPENFSLSRTKLSYLITEALGPYFLENMLKDARGTYYTIQYDETTNAENMKELQIMIRYWSSKKEKVISRHLKTTFIGRATAKVLSKLILQALENANLPLSNMLMLGSDGPNVNIAVHRLINEEVLHLRNCGLINIGTCNIHIVHNSFQKGLEELGNRCSDVVISIFYFFHSFPSRWEEYVKIQSEMGVPSKRFLKHVPSRWLTLGESCVRLLEQLPSTEKYFLQVIPAKFSSLMSNTHYKTVASFLKVATCKMELHFVISSAKLFSRFNATFQKQEPLIHILYDEIRRLCLSLISRVCKSQVLKKVDSTLTWKEEEIFEPENLLPLKEVVVSKEIQDAIAKVPERESILFLLTVQKHYIACCKHLIKKTSFSSSAPFLKSLRFLQPAEKHSNLSCHNIVKAAKYLPVEVPTDALQDEWKLLQLEKNSETRSNGPIDEYWKPYLNLKDSSGNLKYPNISQVIKMCLTLSHGSGDVERGFSQSARILTDDKAAMSEKVLNARLNIQGALKEYNNKPELVPITRELLLLARDAHASYIAELDRKRKVQEMKLKQKEEEAHRNALEIQEKQQLKIRTTHIKDLEKQLNNMKKQRSEKRKAETQLFDLANKKLKDAIQKKIFEELRVAQAMFQGVSTTQKEEEVMGKDMEVFQKQVENKRSNLITTFFKKT